MDKLTKKGGSKMMYEIREEEKVVYELTWCRKCINGSIEMKSFVFGTAEEAMEYWTTSPIGTALPFYKAQIDKITQYQFTKWFDRETIWEIESK